MYPLLKRRKVIIFLYFLSKKGKSSEVQSAALYEGVQRWGIREDVDGIRWAAIASSVVGGTCNTITIHFVISQALELSRSQLHTYSSLRKSYREKETVSYRKPFKKTPLPFFVCLTPIQKDSDKSNLHEYSPMPTFLFTDYLHNHCKKADDWNIYYGHQNMSLQLIGRNFSLKNFFSFVSISVTSNKNWIYAN